MYGRLIHYMIVARHCSESSGGGDAVSVWRSPLRPRPAGSVLCGQPFPRAGSRAPLHVGPRPSPARGRHALRHGPR